MAKQNAANADTHTMYRVASTDCRNVGKIGDHIHVDVEWENRTVLAENGGVGPRVSKIVVRVVRIYMISTGPDSVFFSSS